MSEQDQELALPHLWEKYPRTGSYIADIQAIPFKVPFPLSFIKSKNLPISAIWTIEMAKKSIQSRGYTLTHIINLNEQPWPYTTEEMQKVGVTVIDIPMSYKLLPSPDDITKFNTQLSSLLNTLHEDSVVGICCEDGLNKTGLCISQYLYTVCENDIQYSVNRFIYSNEPGIFKGQFLDHVYKICNELDYHDRLDPIQPAFLTEREFNFYNRNRKSVNRVQRPPHFDPNLQPQQQQSQASASTQLVVSQKRPLTSENTSTSTSTNTNTSTSGTQNDKIKNHKTDDISIRNLLKLEPKLKEYIVPISMNTKSNSFSSYTVSSTQILKEVQNIIKISHDKKLSQPMKEYIDSLTLDDILFYLYMTGFGFNKLVSHTSTKEEQYTNANTELLQIASKSSSNSTTYTIENTTPSESKENKFGSLQQEWKNIAPLMTWLSGEDVLVLTLSTGTFIYHVEDTIQNCSEKQPSTVLYHIPDTQFYQRKQDQKLITGSILTGSIVIENVENNRIYRLLLQDILYFNATFLRDVNASVRSTMVNVEFSLPWSARIQKLKLNTGNYLRVKYRPSFYALRDHIDKFTSVITMVPHAPSGCMFIPRSPLKSIFDESNSEINTNENLFNQLLSSSKHSCNTVTESCRWFSRVHIDENILQNTANLQKGSTSDVDTIKEMKEHVLQFLDNIKNYIEKI